MSEIDTEPTIEIKCMILKGELFPFQKCLKQVAAVVVILLFDDSQVFLAVVAGH